MPPDPSTSPEYAEGRQARRDGRQVTDTPYRQGTAEHWRWLAGWIDADEEDV